MRNKKKHNKKKFILSFIYITEKLAIFEKIKRDYFFYFSL